jgi:hypothetical protein
MQHDLFYRPVLGPLGAYFIIQSAFTMNDMIVLGGGNVTEWQAVFLSTFVVSIIFMAVGVWYFWCGALLPFFARCSGREEDNNNAQCSGLRFWVWVCEPGTKNAHEEVPGNNNFWRQTSRHF